MPNYKDTLNLPRTDFPMRANLAENEPKSLARWESMRIHARLAEARRDAPEFVFHDGPPYANASIHSGHLLNKVMKDMVVRSRLMRGMRCRFVPGWDCHGLPIEHRVMGALVESGEAKAIEALGGDEARMAVRRRCAEHARRSIDGQAADLRRLLTLADYDDPYLTLAPAYERGVLEVFAELLGRGLVFRQLKPVHWSIANRTALAEAELEYEEREDPSIYVDFEAADRGAVAAAFGLDPIEGLDTTPSFMIWTTTPWTLPANLAIAVNPRFRYALVEIDGSTTVVAADRVASIVALTKAESVRTLAEADGARLAGLTYRHPFCERTGRIVEADYVTLEDGTGLVHTAPGHGDDDWRTGLREGLEVYCPVRGDGTYDDSVPSWLRGMNIWKANDRIAEQLRESGHLVHLERFVHSYPHDWRGRSPVIFRATEQWFIGVDRPVGDGAQTLRALALEATADAVSFVPEWGRNRLRGMLESRPDWCISRQRAWGLPIPAFERPDGSLFMTPASVRAVAAALGERGSDAWFEEPPQRLLADYRPSDDPDAPAGLDPAALRKTHDIFDVWFESGCSWNAVLRARGLGYPADLYLEGSDQHRGWFQASLLPALGATGVAPFRTLVTHGFIVDRDGRKMSKSLGNTIEVERMLREFGAEVCRWWVSSIAFENDIRLDLEYLRLAGESYRKVRNTIRFLLSNLDDLPAGEAAEGAPPPAESLDGWVLGQAAELRRTVLDAYERYEFRTAHQALHGFCNETLSAIYCSAVKDRLYCDRRDAPRRRRAQRTMRSVAELLCTLLAPILPHTADEAWRAMDRDDDACVHLETVPPLDAEAHPDWALAMAARDEALRALEQAKQRGIENPLDAAIVLPDPEGRLARFRNELPDLLGVSRVRLEAAAPAVAVEDLRAEARCERSWRRDGTVRARSDGGMLSDRDAEAIGVA